MGGRQPAPVWSEHDSAIWHTGDIARCLVTGRIDERPVIATPFPPHIAADERFLATGSFELLTHRAVGDGSYQDNGGFFLAGGRGGLAFTGAVAAARAVGNSKRRAAAAAAMAPRWVVDDGGSLFLSTHGFYLQTTAGLFPWTWMTVSSAEMVGPGGVHVQGQSDGGAISWIVQSCWAELLFVLWAMTVHPGHPQLATGGWIPPGWHERNRERQPREPRSEPDATKPRQRTLTRGSR